jgi:hypothetical protein
VAVPDAGLDPGYEQLRDAALHARANAFPLGLALLTRHGVTGWRRALSSLTSDTSKPPAPRSPAGPAPDRIAGLAGALAAGAIAAELIDALAGLALAGT